MSLSAVGASPLTSIATPTMWMLTIAGVLVLLAVDFLLTRKPHEVTTREGRPHTRPAWRLACRSMSSGEAGKR